MWRTKLFVRSFVRLFVCSFVRSYQIVMVSNQILNVLRIVNYLILSTGDKVTTTYQGKKRKRMPEMYVYINSFSSPSMILLMQIGSWCRQHESKHCLIFTVCSYFLSHFRKKVNISDYIEAVYRILEQRDEKERNRYITTNSVEQLHVARANKTANIYLATEDPEAVEEFRKALPVGWSLFVDQFLIDTSHHRVDEYNGSPKMAKALNGKAGLLALGSLLVAMEANDFVLTTASNWSRLMDELRQSILDPRCGNCTSMIDLRR